MKAFAHGLRVPPRKMSTVAALVRGRSVDDAYTILEHTPRRAAAELKSLIHSAAANAEHNDKLDRSQLYVDTITVGSGGMLKRPEFRAYGRVNFVKKRMSNVKVWLATTSQESHGS